MLYFFFNLYVVLKLWVSTLWSYSASDRLVLLIKKPRKLSGALLLKRYRYLHAITSLTIPIAALSEELSKKLTSSPGEMIHMANHLQCLFIHLCTSYTGDWRKHAFLCSSQTRTDGSVNPAAVLGLQLCNFWKGRLVCEHWKWLSQLFSFCCLLSNATLQVTFLISMLLLEYLPAFHVHLLFLVLSDSLCFLFSCLLKFSSVFFLLAKILFYLSLDFSVICIDWYLKHESEDTEQLAVLSLAGSSYKTL